MGKKKGGAGGNADRPNVVPGQSKYVVHKRALSLVYQITFDPVDNTWCTPQGSGITLKSFLGYSSLSAGYQEFKVKKLLFNILGVTKGYGADWSCIIAMTGDVDNIIPSVGSFLERQDLLIFEASRHRYERLPRLTVMPRMNVSGRGGTLGVDLQSPWMNHDQAGNCELTGVSYIMRFPPASVSGLKPGDHTSLEVLVTAQVEMRRLT